MRFYSRDLGCIEFLLAVEGIQEGLTLFSLPVSHANQAVLVVGSEQPGVELNRLLERLFGTIVSGLLEVKPSQFKMTSGQTRIEAESLQKRLFRILWASTCELGSAELNPVQWRGL